MNSAALTSEDGRYRLELRLKPLPEWQHEDWITYEIALEDLRNGSRATLRSTHERDVYLDRAIDPEVPALCAGIRNAINLKRCFSFEPVDESDFQFDIDGSGEEIKVRLQFYYSPAADELGWPRGLVVRREDILRFASELQEAFDRIERERESPHPAVGVTP